MYMAPKMDFNKLNNERIFSIKKMVYTEMQFYVHTLFYKQSLIYLE